MTPEKKPREGWEELFRAARADTADELLLEPLPPNVFDRESGRGEAIAAPLVEMPVRERDPHP